MTTKKLAHRAPNYVAELICGHQFLNDFEVSLDDVVFCWKCDDYSVAYKVSGKFQKGWNPRTSTTDRCNRGHPPSEKTITKRANGKQRVWCRACCREDGVKGAEAKKYRAEEMK